MLWGEGHKGKTHPKQIGMRRDTREEVFGHTHQTLRLFASQMLRDDFGPEHSGERGGAQTRARVLLHREREDAQHCRQAVRRARPSPLASGTVPRTMPSPSSASSITVWPVFSSFPAASWRGASRASRRARACFANRIAGCHTVNSRTARGLGFGIRT